MTTKVILSTLSGLVFVFAFLPYIKAIVEGKAKPRKATWLVWTVGDWIIVAGMIAKDTISGLMLGAVLGATITFLLSLKYGEPGWRKRDKICISLSAFAIVCWLYFGDSNFGIFWSLTALAIAVWPTYVSAWENPANEDRKAWVLFNIANLLAALAIPSWTFSNAPPPFTFMGIDIPMLFLLFVRPYHQRRTLQIQTV